MGVNAPVIQAWVYEGQVANSTHGHPCGGRLRAIEETAVTSTEQAVKARCEKCGAEMQQIARAWRLHNGPEDPDVKAKAVTVFQPKGAMQVSKDEVAAVLPAFTAVWGDKLPVEQRSIFARICLAYGYDPLMGDVVILGGRLYVTSQARIRKAQEHEDYGGFDCDWLDKPEDEATRKAMGIGPEDIVCRARVYRRGKRDTVAFGTVRMAERVEINKWGKKDDNGKPVLANPIVASNPQEMAYKRAVERAHRHAYSMPLPSAHEAPHYEADYVRQKRVDVETGEITEVIDDEVNVTGSTAEQRGMIHILLNELGIPDEAYYAELKKLYGVDSSKNLNASQASEYIDALKRRERRHERGSPMSEDVPPEPDPEEPPEGRLL